MKLLFLFMLIGCAVSSVVLKRDELIPYKDSSKRTKLSLGDLQLHIESVRDLRGSQEIGFAYTGVKYLKTPIHLEKPFDVFINDYFTTELERRGIEVLNDSAYRLEISIITFKTYELVEKFKPERAKCELQFDFKLSEGLRSWTGNYSTDYISEGNLQDGTKRLAPTMASCLNNIVEKLVEEDEFQTFFQKQ